MDEFPETSLFRPVRTLGRGGMGVVFEAEDVKTGARVALKVMLKNAIEALLRFKQEFRTVAGLQHPNLVQLHELFHENRAWFFTMELVIGQNLRTALLDDATDVWTPSSDEAPA